MKVLILTFLCSVNFMASAYAQKVMLPEKGAYFGAYVDAGPLAEEVRPHEIEAFELLTGKPMAWVYFSNNWTDGEIDFPYENVEICRKMGRIPYIRLMPWSEDSGDGKADPIFTMDAFLKGTFDEKLIEWARQASESPGPIILEFGPEVNGNWFPWNGQWNGGSRTTRYGDPRLPDGPEKFRDVYRRIITLFKIGGLTEATWVLHVDTARMPEASWNSTSNYYPGDENIDWIGLSVFGAQLPTHDWIEFMPKFKSFWPEIQEIAKRKPVIISEFAVIEDKKNPSRKADWIARALRTIESGLYPIKGISYWNSPGWLADGSADFRITSSEKALNSFVGRINQDFWKIITAPIQPSEDEQ
ncbi:glycosyl hydrolase [Bacteriovorax sp. PP10]|uniref:Glycosyl hydrolase n=1 Tax=Bacteriovorax antarcticus TaxID=3088717 RepID=A0ABU5VYL6_9BACT|nr:glycosyl hydrolase [Bacteriovorax sp. PP10]MEA9358165.1 glycosyl hydrolase [Bacteriovorax sp. PP10]